MLFLNAGRIKALLIGTPLDVDLTAVFLGGYLPAMPHDRKDYTYHGFYVPPTRERYEAAPQPNGGGVYRVVREVETEDGRWVVIPPRRRNWRGYLMDAINWWHDRREGVESDPWKRQVQIQTRYNRWRRRRVRLIRFIAGADENDESFG